MAQRSPHLSPFGGGPLAVRRGLAAAAPAAYVAIAAARAGAASFGTWLVLALALAVGFVGGSRATRTDGPAPSSRDEVRPGDRLLFAASTCLSVALATSLLGPSPWVDMLREASAMGSGLVTARALATIEPEGGLSARATEATASWLPRALRYVAVAIPIVTWGSLALASALAYGRDLGADPLVVASAPVASALSAMGLALTAFGLAGARRLELSAPARLLAIAGANAGGLLLGVALALFGPFRAEAAVAIGAASAALPTLWIARAADSLSIARGGRRTATLAIFGIPVVMLGAVAGLARLPAEGLVAVGIASAALLVGLFVPRLEETFMPANGTLLRALDDARAACRERDTRAAIARVLVRLREAAGAESTSPELWLLHPARVCTVDAAGYLREREAELPPLLVDIARDEPELTLRTDVLRALEVRRADLRPLLHWLEGRDALFATLVTDGEDVDAVLVVPAGRRVEALTLDEVSRARRLADALVATCQAISARERHLGRERDLRRDVEALEDELARVRHAQDLDASRHALASIRLARPATVGIYAATSRMAFEALERRIGNEAPVVVVARAGVDPVPYVARAHLAGPRKDAPLVIVDGTSSREHDPARWKDEKTSPLALADRGLLVLVDGAALPRDVQVLVARALAERRPPWERAMPLDIAIALTSTSAPDLLVEDGRLAPELAARFEGATSIELPGLADRAEDLRAIVADRLAREGLRARGRPVGIDAAAFARLVEHPFEAEDAELSALVTRLVAIAKDDVVRAGDLDALGIGVTDDERVSPRPSAARGR